MTPPSTPRSQKAFQRKLLAWYRRTARDLPWRDTRNPYAILVSEFMLQQTQVSRVTEYFPRFMARFPTLGSLARSRPNAVMEAWDGLGYYARARNLHKLAKGLSGTGYRLPDDPDELIKLPGVGRYTAGAVACFAYEKPVPAVDVNVARVIRRVFYGTREEGGVTGVSESPRPASPIPRPREIWKVATTLVPKNGKRAWRFNQAIMELGALVCTARKPKCPECPLRRGCALYLRSKDRSRHQR